MKAYDPNRNPDPGDWLDIDEGERILLVTSYHRRARIRMPNTNVHATFHVIVENQLAMGIPEVEETVTRLQGEGLSRHDAIHAVASVLAAHMYELWKKGPAPEQGDPNVKYFDELKRLTAAGWRDLDSSE